LLNFVLPQISCQVGTQNYGRFVISPLEKGYGTTLGNALRRVLLSSLDGAAVTSLRVANVSHEFSTIPGVREDMMLFILNVKQIRFRLPRPPVSALYAPASAEAASTGGALEVGSDVYSSMRRDVDLELGSALPVAGMAAVDSAAVDAVSADSSSMTFASGGAFAGLEGPMRLRLSVRGQGAVTAGDIVCPPEIEVANPELYLLTVDDPEAELDIEMTVERGRGYSPSEERGKLPIGELPVDAIYSPIRRANFDVAPARVGQMTNYDSLVLEIWTDGTIRPQVALGYAAQLLIRHFGLFTGVETLVAETEAGPAAADMQPQEVPSRVADVPIEELDLSVRVYNCLKRTGITKVDEVLAKMEKGPDEMLSIRNFGSKSLDELVLRLEEKGYLEEGAFTW
jgi:DNA-directed RNA polymerase alpha subunit